MEDSGDQANPKAFIPAPGLEPLSILIGKWKIEVPGASDGATEVEAHVTFEWMAGGRFLIERSEVDLPFVPDTLCIIGLDEATGYIQHYFDSRGVKRVYSMSLCDGGWKLWRDDPDFAQRYSGTFSADGNTITGAWEIAEDRVTWRHDFDLIYTRVRD